MNTINKKYDLSYWEKEKHIVRMITTFATKKEDMRAIWGRTFFGIFFLIQINFYDILCLG